MIGEFLWHELMTPDPAGASEFYRHVVGWDARTIEMPDLDYRIMSKGGADIAGIMPPVPGAEGAGAFWFSYIGVSDVDEAAQILSGAGGAVHKEPEDIEGVGRFAMVTDPQGAAFALFTPVGPMDTRPHPMTPGHVGWHELHSTEGKAAWAFYKEQFGWQEQDAMDMGEMGIYQIFRPAGGAPADGGVGAIFTSPDMPRPLWLLYFSVPDIDEGRTRIEAGGGTTVGEKMEVPGGAWIINAKDPQGAMFALVAGPKG